MATDRANAGVPPDGGSWGNCYLYPYAEWHLREASTWREMLFADEDQPTKLERDPVALARRSPAAEGKVRSRTIADGTPIHSLRTLLDELATQVRNTCRPVGAAAASTFELTTLAPTQHRASP